MPWWSAVRRRMPRPSRLPRTGALLLAVLAIGCTNASGAVPRPVETGTPEPPEQAIEKEIVTADGVRLSGQHFRASEERVVILLHGYDHTQASWFEIARAIQREGWLSVITVDFRGHGLSEGEESEPSMLVNDVVAVVEYARGLGYGSIALVGASMGGTAAIAAAAEHQWDDLAGIVALSPPVRFLEVDAELAVPHVTVPLAILAAEADLSAADSLQRLAEAGELPDHRTVLVPGIAHGVAMLDAEGGEAVTQRLRDYLREFWGR